MTGAVSLIGVSVPGYVPKKGEDPRNVWVITQAVSAGFFRVSGMRVKAGREFSDRDDAGAPNEAVISQSLAEHFFSGKDPVGQRILLDKAQTATTIVGVVRDIKVFGMREGRQELIFTPLFRSGMPGSATLWVRTASDPARVAGRVRDAIRSVAAKVPQMDVTTVEQQVADSLSEARLLAVLAGAFGALALILATIGLYGVISYDATRRTHEIGVRMALGAERGNIWRLVAGNTVRLLAIGMAIGVGIAIAGARVGASLLFGVTASDVWPIASAVGVLTVAGLVGGVVPAMRASGVEPTVVLRHE